MKKRQIIIYALFVVLVVSLVGNSILSILAIIFNNDVLDYNFNLNEPPSLLIKGITFLKFIGVLLFCLGIFYLLKILNLFTRERYFSNRQVVLFRRSGNYFVISGILGFLCQIVPLLLILNKQLNYAYSIYLNFDSKALYIILVIIGLICITFARVIKEGSDLKIENDLTI